MSPCLELSTPAIRTISTPEQGGCLYTSLPHHRAAPLVHSALGCPLSQPWLFGTWCSWVGLSRMFWNKAWPGGCYWRLPVIHLCWAFSGWVRKATDLRAFADPVRGRGRSLVRPGSKSGCSRDNDYSSPPPPTIVGNTPETPIPAKGYLERELTTLLRCVIGGCPVSDVPGL